MGATLEYSESLSRSLLPMDPHSWDKDTDPLGQGDTPKKGFPDESEKWKLLGTHAISTSNLTALAKENKDVAKKDSYLWSFDRGLKVLTQMRAGVRQTSSLPW